MTTSKIILMNGPIECGKNTAVDMISACSPRVVKDRRCKDHLFKLTWEFFCMTEEEFFEHYEDRATKETPKEGFAVSAEAYNALMKVLGNPTFNTDELDAPCKLSVREALIYVSEVLCKPTFGVDYFGKARAKTITGNEWAIDDSCGFDDEIGPTVDKLGMDNVLLIRIHGRGTFEGDSRKFISDGVVDNVVDIDNSGTESEFLDKIEKVAFEFYLGK